MADIKIEIDETLEKELLKNIEKFQQKFPQVLAEIIEAWANEVVNYARTNFRYLTPWEIRQPTGNLLNSLRVKIELSKDRVVNAEIIAGGSTGEVSQESKGLTGITADVPYAVYVEFGTEHSRPNPYLKPAVESLLPKLNTMLGQAFAKISL
jgi:HK97 gp10 family phage protein